MNQTPAAAAERTVVAATLREFSRQPVAEQTRLKSQLEALVAIALQILAPRERIVLEAPEGLVVVILAGPASGLDVAERLQAGAADLPVCIAVNQGPVKALEESGAGPRFAGDGIVAALTLASLATRSRLLVSRSMREALLAAAPHRAKSLVSVGVLTDATLRSHQLFTPDPHTARAGRRQLMLVGSAAILAVLGTGVAARLMRGDAAAPAIIQFEITPNGEVFVDGVLKGKSPPLMTLAVSPGPHTIEVRTSGHPPLQLKTNLKPGEELKVNHAFTGRKARKEGDSVVEDIMRRLWNR